MGGGPDFAGYTHLANTLAFLLPIAERLGIAAANEVNLEGLADRIRQEVVASRSSLVTQIVVGAWVRRIGARPDPPGENYGWAERRKNHAFPTSASAR